MTLDPEPAASGLSGPPVPRAGLARSSAIFASGAIAGKLVGVLMLPVLVRNLSTADFGRLDVLSTMVSAAVSALLIGLELAALRLYPDSPPARRRSLHASWYLLSTGMVLPFSIGLIALSRPVSRALFDRPDYALGVAMVGLTTLVGTWLVIGLTILRSQHRAGAYAGVTAGSLLLNAVLTVILLLHWRAGVGAVLVAMAISQGAGALVSGWLVRKEAVGRPTAHAGKALLRLALPLAPAVVATWVGEFGNRAILLATRGPEEVGYLSLAVRFGSVGMLVVSAFHNAWQPQAFALGSDREALSRLAPDARKIVVTVCTAVVALALVSPEVAVIVAGRRYVPALPAIGFELLFAMGAGLYLVATMPSSLARRTGDLSIAGCVAVAVTVGLNLALSGPAGSGGSAAAMAGGQLAGVGVALGFGRARLPTEIQWARLSALAMLTSLIVCAACLPDGGSPVWARLVMGCIFAGLVSREAVARNTVLRFSSRLLN
ncbi:MAG: lipopolysaccharide biosynthesis protein [Acidimicrobiia bacterium]